MKRLAIMAVVLLALAGLAVLGGLFWWNSSLEQFARTPYGSPEEKTVEIPSGAGMKQVARLFAGAGVVGDETRFYWLARRLGIDRRIKAGEYGFSGPIAPEKVLEQIAQGRVKLYSCTIPEGLRADEVAPLLEQCGFGKASELLALARDADFAKKAGLKADSLEGYLYPDTYSFPKNPKAGQVLLKMVSRYNEEYRKADALRQKGIGLDPHETATLASIIEKETGDPQERPRISCVFHNRLKKKMKLETDPTVIYAKILRYGSFDGNIKRDDLEYFHPYNTYRVKGLPPGPIASAGAAALQAALDPIECDDLFFVACGGGTHKFCPDYTCHQRWVDICQRGRK
ncbi:MAG TPA: endolytic transglycosylase MltG [Myxococcales bacterium]|nr:endolytic transglycosylase MltG [Myxococcales bacterium]